MRCVSWFAMALTVAAQNPPQFGVQSRLVLVPATVTDTKGRSLDNLEPSDFLVLDNGRPQKATVDSIATGVAPIALVVAIQASGISKAALEKVRKVGAMIEPFITGDRGCAAVMAFSERISWIQKCTNDEGLISRAFAEVTYGQPKQARMLDAVDEAIQHLKERPNARRVLLLISESRDRSSKATLDDVAVAAQTAGVAIYAATYSAFKTSWTTKSSATADPQMPKRPKTPSEETGTNSGGPVHCTPFGCPDPPLLKPDQSVDLKAALGELRRLGQTNTAQALTQGAGGALLPFTRLKGLEEAIQKLGAELHSQYVLSFVPDDNTPGFHAIQVRVARDDAHVRARPGYWSTQ